MTSFRDRPDAGRALARRLLEAGTLPTVVLGLPRGGVPVAAEVAGALHAPLDVFVVRKLGVPGHRELAMGAVASGGVRVLNERLVASLSIPPAAIEAVAGDEARELARREAAYRSGRPALDLAGADVLLVDDGLATGATMRAAIEAVRQLGPNSVTVGVPVGAQATCNELAAVADAIVCVESPANFYAVGQWYDDFTQTHDDEIVRLLAANP
ncbi:MAG: phosphoribosyltransferase [Actinobacteria bacterium]|nr:phosphoribosyltransferase [Actinomycetota bacterium]MBV9254618.1 phosphoribosyltransferase [Actinomycetota bacterium]